MDLARLRRETEQDHDRTEAAVPLMTPGLSRAAYADVLGRMYGFVRGWDLWAAAHAPEDLRAMLADRQRSRLLKQDLRFLKRAIPDRVATLPAMPVTRAGFLGRMYVVEGSTLGGQFLAAHVEQEFGFTRGEGNAYFVGYGTRTGSMWNGFKELLLALPESDADEVITASKDTFTAFRNWMTESDGMGGQPAMYDEPATHA